MTDRQKAWLSLIAAWGVVAGFVLIGLFLHHPHWAAPWNPANPAN